ncbi:MAG: hypothetical protein M3354_04905 [Chloroflexota bacterium]|nr:hypothetical protein [Chloroflexota bacterium]
MDDSRFDNLVKALTSESRSRRGVLRGLAAGLLGIGLSTLGSGARAAACKQNGRRCRNGNQCCSGLCTGKKDRKKCRRAPGQGTCTIAKDTCTIGGQAAACDPGLTGACSCFRRPNGAAFCADTTTFDCLPCAECPAGTTCVRARNGICVSCPVGSGATDTICVRPCEVIAD